MRVRIGVRADARASWACRNTAPCSSRPKHEAPETSSCVGKGRVLTATANWVLACCSTRPTNIFIVGADERAASTEAPAPRAPAAEAAEAEAAEAEGTAEPGRPVRKEMSVDVTHTAVGWLFHVDDVFDRERLRSFLARALAQPDVQRCKVLALLPFELWHGRAIVMRTHQQSTCEHAPSSLPSKCSCRLCLTWQGTHTAGHLSHGQGVGERQLAARGGRDLYAHRVPP